VPSKIAANVCGGMNSSGARSRMCRSKRLNAARYEVVDPRPRLGYGEENSVPGLLFEGGKSLKQRRLSASNRRLQRPHWKDGPLSTPPP
jgi:hypothetical protein